MEPVPAKSKRSDTFETSSVIAIKVLEGTLTGLVYKFKYEYSFNLDNFL